MAGRRRKQLVGIDTVRAEQEFVSLFPRLAEAEAAWRDGGDAKPLHDAIDALEQELDQVGWYEYPVNGDRSARLVALSHRLRAVTQLQGRLQSVLGQTTGLRQFVEGELMATMAEPPKVPTIMEKTWKRLQREGVGERELHPASRKQAKAIKAALAGCLTDPDLDAPDDFKDIPVRRWEDLPRSFNGYTLVNIDDDRVPEDPTPLPPYTDIAAFTEDGKRPEPLGTFKETVQSFRNVILDWGLREGSALRTEDLNVWAFLLAHYIDSDDKTWALFNRQIIEAPWSASGMAYLRLEQSDVSNKNEPDDEVPF